MKISYQWLKQYLDIDLPAEQVARILTGCGLEVEGLETIQPVKGGLKGVVIGEVKSCSKHPNSDHLSLTTVDIGAPELLSIVCGAANVRAGQKVPVATIGTVLYKGDESFEIKLSKIRGEVSQGMICAEDELGIGTSHAGIMELSPDAPVGMPASRYFNIKEDTVFEIGLTPNRTDAMSHIGVARDLLAALKCQDPAFSGHELHIPPVRDFKPDNHELPISVIIEDTTACPRYTGVSVSGVTVRESPGWLRDFLSQAGVRPINNLVDISNYVMLETGQPLHFFDADEITGQKVIIRKLPSGSLFVTLDEVKRELTGDDLMICNAVEGMCMAGVFGGFTSGVTGKTTRIFIESAHFHPQTIRKTSKHHGLQTDSSFRFERGVDPNGTVYALKRAALLVRELAGGRIASEIVDCYPVLVPAREITVRYSYIDRLIGKQIPRPLIREILTSTGMNILNDDQQTLVVQVPTFKADVTREADVVEEVLRIYGYNNVELPARVNTSVVYWEKPDKGKIKETVSGYLTGNGFYEIMNNSLSNPAYSEKDKDTIPGSLVEIMNPLSRELQIMRQTLLFGGLESIIYNINRKAPDLRFFEFGKTYRQDTACLQSDDVTVRYREEDHLAIFLTGRREPEHWQTIDKTVDIFLLKAHIINILQRLGVLTESLSMQSSGHSLLVQHASLVNEKGTLVEMGSVSQEILDLFNIKQEVLFADINWDLLFEMVKGSRIEFTEWPRFPEVRRDLALLLPAPVRFEDIERLAFQVEKRLLKRIRLFDVYEGEKIGEGKKSYAVTFVLQDNEKTLTDPEIDHVMKRLIRAFETQLQAVIR